LIQERGETPESHRPNWDRGLQLLVAQRGISRRRSSSNCADYVPAICTHRPSLFPMMVQYRLSDWRRFYLCWKVNRYFFNRGSKSRNKVAVGEPAAGSFFRMIYTKPRKSTLHWVNFSHTTTKLIAATSIQPEEHGSHNVSRWMTWLPISLKNAAKCDKWYQLQNHSITESLNAKGAREKPFMGHPRACHILSVEHI
jgi:hypothetical protein